MMEALMNPMIWIGTTVLFFLLFAGLLIILILLAKKTHAIIEFKAWLKGKPIAMYFLESGYCDWKPVQVEAGIIQDKDYGAYIVNEKARYIDKTTKNVFLPFDASIAAGVNVKAAKVADDISYILQDEEQLKQLRRGIAEGTIGENDSFESLKTTVHFGSIKSMMTAMIPHNINAKIEKVIASRIKNLGQVNVPQIAMLFAAIFGAILLGALVIRLAF